MLLIPDMFSFKTAWRDARSQYKSLLLYCSGIVAGVAALVAILSFRSDVMLTVDDQAKELLGSDLEISQYAPYPESLNAYIDSIGGEQSRAIEFSTMVVYGTSGKTLLSQIRAIEGGFPFYGEIKTEPEDAAFRYQNERSALVDRPVMNQLGLVVGDSIRVGNELLVISGIILEIPGESAAFSLVGPRVIIPRDVVEGSGLLDRGSIVQYKTYFRFGDVIESRSDQSFYGISKYRPGTEPESSFETESDSKENGKQDKSGMEKGGGKVAKKHDLDRITSEIRELADDRRIRISTVESRKEDFAEVVDTLARFLGMIGFIALMLGALGVASAVYVYIKRKSATVATLRCLGASSRQTLQIFGLQIMGLGLIGSMTGSLFGLLIQRLLPLLFADFLPFELLQQVSVPALILGFLTGVMVSFSLALLPLISINNIPPLLTIRSTDYSPLANVAKSTRMAVSTGIVVALTMILALLLESLLVASIFIGGLIISVLILLATSRLLIQIARKLRLPAFSYVWRQGIANMFRPNNQTAILVTTLGMGMLLIGSMYLSQEMILARINLQTGGDQPNLVFYDIQSDQNEDVMDIAKREGARIIENVPIVSMRLSHIGKRSIREIRDDTTRQASNWALTREYRVTYREKLNEAEKILEGEWIGRSEGIDSGVRIPISLEHRYAEDLNVSIGDSLTFNLQGVPVETRIASIREVDFQRPQPNFFVLFPAGVLGQVPRFYALTIHTPDEQTTSTLQQEVVRAHPNVSAIDIGLVLESVRSFLDKVAMAVQFMALFSIVTGLIVLASAVAISRFQRIRETVLLRTLGASRRQIRGIQFVEYLWLGLLACMTGLLLAFVASLLLAWFYFDLVFVPDLLAIGSVSLIIIVLTLGVGFLNMGNVLSTRPLEVLRMNAEG